MFINLELFKKFLYNFTNNQVFFSKYKIYNEVYN